MNGIVNLLGCKDGSEEIAPPMGAIVAKANCAGIFSASSAAPLFAGTLPLLPKKVNLPACRIGR
jgi:hypothetical protein